MLLTFGLVAQLAFRIVWIFFHRFTLICSAKIMELNICRCLARTMKNTIKVRVPNLKFDSFLKMHFREYDDVLVHDPQESCKPNDWVLIKKLPEKLSLQVEHQLVKVVYSAGNIVDPITGKRCSGYDYEEDYEKLSDYLENKVNKGLISE